MIDAKFVCPFCGFESSGPGLCPTCDDNLEKVCACGSGKFSLDCCGANEEETDNSENLIKAEVAGESLKEIAAEDEAKLKEEEDLANVKEIDED